jgi:hypothetical protein
MPFHRRICLQINNYVVALTANGSVVSIVTSGVVIMLISIVLPVAKNVSGRLKLYYPAVVTVKG